MFLILNTLLLNLFILNCRCDEGCCAHTRCGKNEGELTKTCIPEDTFKEHVDGLKYPENPNPFYSSKGKELAAECKFNDDASAVQKCKGETESEKCPKAKSVLVVPQVIFTLLNKYKSFK